MINTFAELLTAIKEQGVKEIEPYLNIPHNPTIGNMYEGLTKQLADKVIFKELNLKVTSGMITNNEGKFSRQIDCMIVVGEGNKIPHTEDYVYHINDVVAVIEVKKNFYTKDLDSSYYNLKSVVDTFEATTDLELSQVIDSYRNIFGEELPERSELEELPFHKQMVYHTLILESYLPIRIVLGYEGFKDEYSLREGFINFLSDNEGMKGFGALNFPSLILCKESSIIKLNGMPYAARVNADDKWALCASYGKDPMLILLELIWTRLIYKHNLSNSVFGDAFKVENINPFLVTTAVTSEEIMGWTYDYIHKSRSALEEEAQKEEIWSPANVSNTAYVIFTNLCNDIRVNFSDTRLIEFIESQNLTVEAVRNEVLETGLVHIDKDGDIHLSTKQCQCAITPEGFLVGENVDGRFNKYIFGSMR